MKMQLNISSCSLKKSLPNKNCSLLRVVTCFGVLLSVTSYVAISTGLSPLKAQCLHCAAPLHLLSNGESSGEANHRELGLICHTSPDYRPSYQCQTRTQFWICDSAIVQSLPWRQPLKTLSHWSSSRRVMLSSNPQIDLWPRQM